MKEDRYIVIEMPMLVKGALSSYYPCPKCGKALEDADPAKWGIPPDDEESKTWKHTFTCTASDECTYHKRLLVVK